MDLADHGDEFVVTADVPGFETDDIDLRLRDDALVISAEREQSTEEGEENYIRSEREHRSLVESVRLPESVDEDGTSAGYHNGVLTVRLPKAEPSGEDGKRVEIGGETSGAPASHPRGIVTPIRGEPRGRCSPVQLLDDRVAVVTGGSSGIGRAIALPFADDGASGVVVADIRDEPKGDTSRSLSS